MPDSDHVGHARPPQAIRDAYKRLQRAKDANVENEATSMKASPSESLPHDDRVSPRATFEEFTKTESEASLTLPDPATCNIPGLLIYRSLLPPEAQLLLLSKIFLRDLNNPEHLTNVHLHYDVPSPPLATSYFDASASNLHFKPLDPTVHKSFTTHQYLNKKLRWMTLGGQYDWTNKVYPAEKPPPFPPDMAKLVGDLFNITPEAAIVNLYAPGDTLSLHRDVSEECDRPLASLSLGCDGIFLVGLEGSTETGARVDEPRIAVLRLRSGDAVVMSGESRYAWHGVPKVVEGTCPDWMEDWPGVGDDAERFNEWKGWMKGKRINLNVRQMFA